jgi:hypothetical protein
MSESDRKYVVFVEGLGLVDDFMVSDDLNECVEALLFKRNRLDTDELSLGNRGSGSEPHSDSVAPPQVKCVVKRSKRMSTQPKKRLRKNEFQHKYLMKEFVKQRDWSN